MQIILTEVGLYVRLKYGPFLCVDSDLRWLLFKSHTTHFDPALENVMKFSTLDLNYSFSQVLRGGGRSISRFDLVACVRLADTFDRSWSYNLYQIFFHKDQLLSKVSASLTQATKSKGLIDLPPPP